MGILARPAEIVRSLPLPRGFAVCDLGNQFYRADGGKSPARDFWFSLGAGDWVSIDANGQGDIKADLNYPLADQLLNDVGLFDLVTDFGTGEHIFNQAQVFMTLHGLCKTGGYIVIDRPKQGWAEHCFYNVHDTLIRDIAHANAYELIHVETHRVEGHGELLLAAMRKMSDAGFRYPNQGKYKAMLAAAGQRPVGESESQRLVPRRIKRGDVLINLIRHNGWTRGAEIGVLDGEAVFFRLLNEFPDLTMYAVDRWSATDQDYGDLTAIGEAFKKRTDEYGLRAGVLEGNSAEMAVKIADRRLDFVFIDASHDYDSVKADIAAWTPKVKPGGMVLGHDWNPERFPGVINAVLERWAAPLVMADHVWGVRI